MLMLCNTCIKQIPSVKVRCQQREIHCGVSTVLCPVNLPSSPEVQFVGTEIFLPDGFLIIHWPTAMFDVIGMSVFACLFQP